MIPSTGLDHLCSLGEIRLLLQLLFPLGSATLQLLLEPLQLLAERL